MAPPKSQNRALAWGFRYQRAHFRCYLVAISAVTGKLRLGNGEQAKSAGGRLSSSSLNRN